MSLGKIHCCHVVGAVCILYNSTSLSHHCMGSEQQIGRGKMQHTIHDESMEKKRNAYSCSGLIT